MTEASLRRLDPDDADQALGMVRDYYSHDGLTFDEAVSSAILELLETAALGRFWGIEYAGATCGYIVLTFGFDHEFGGRIGVVTDFFLEAEHRGRGLGSQVLRLVAEEARSLGLKRIELVVLEHNLDGRRFYERAGFTPVAGRQTMALPLADGN